MTCITYNNGNTGIPLLCFPTQDSHCNNLEDFGMIHTMSDFIENGQIQVYCVDTVDIESWSAYWGSNDWRAARQEQYFHYITDEFVPFIHETSQSPVQPLVTGFSMGGTHAAVTFLRRPDLFSGMLAVSGVYDSGYFYGNWMNDTLYYNSPVAFIPNMENNHPYIELYNKKPVIFCVGQGPWEDEGVRTLKILERQFAEKGIHAWADFWGYDVNHDWPWWKHMIRYHIPHLLEGIEKK